MNKEYIINTNEKARERLDLQHSLYVKNSVALLQEAGVGPGMSGLEIGCGSGAMTAELAKLVGAQGQLLSIDLVPEQVTAAQEFIKSSNWVRFKVWDVNHLTDLNEKFDFIYCRMVLHHLADAHSAILQMKETLKPGGIVICEEPSIFNAGFCNPPSPAYDQFFKYIRSCFTENKRDFEIAHRLEQEFSACGFSVLEHSLYQPLLRHPAQKKLYPMALTDFSTQILEHKIANKAEIEELKNELEELIQTNCTMTWIRMHQLIAKKI